MLSDLHLAIIINSERFPFLHIISGYYVFIMIYPKPWINGIQTIDRSMTLNLKTIHKCFVCPYKKAELSSMFHYIQIFTNTCEVTVQIKRAIGKAILHKLPIYYEYNVMCFRWAPTIFGMICLFSNRNKSSTTRLRSFYITFYLWFKCATFLCALTPRNALRRSTELCFL